MAKELSPVHKLIDDLRRLSDKALDEGRLDAYSVLQRLLRIALGVQDSPTSSGILWRLLGALRSTQTALSTDLDVKPDLDLGEDDEP
jgi:hypothetical protein